MCYTSGMTTRGREFVICHCTMLFLLLPLLVCAAAFAQSAPVSTLPKSMDVDVSRIAAEHYGGDAPWYLNNIPFLIIDDPLLEKVYYYRWQVYRSHLREIGPQGVMVTEFLDNVPWGRQPYTDLNDSSPFHLLEGRWLRSPAVVNSMIEHLYTGYGNDRHFSEAIAGATLEAVKVTGDTRPALRNLPAMMYVYNGWDDHFDRARNLYWIQPIDDATEYTISSIDATGAGFVTEPSKNQDENGFLRGYAFRPSINVYQYANALAIARFAELDGRPELAAEYRRRGEAVRKAVLDQLWNPSMQHFVDRYQRTTKYVNEGEFIRGRELVGYTPWLYELPPAKTPEYAEAWRHVLDPKELAGPKGLRTVEPSYPGYMAQYRYDGSTGLPECQWNGPSWPFQNSQVLTGMANLLADYKQSVVTSTDYLTLLRQYAQQHLAADGHPDLQEDYNPDTGAPIVGLPRSHHYNHSTFNALILGGLIGIRPSLDDKLVLKPLIPADSSIRYFALDRLVYHGHNIGIVYDADGTRFGVGKGLSIYVDGRLADGPAPLGELSVALPKSKQFPEPEMARRDLAVNIGEPHGPRPTASSAISPGSPAEAIDGRLWFFPENPNGWSPEPGEPSWFAVDFERDEKVSAVELYFFADGKSYLPPTSYALECKNGDSWHELGSQQRDPASPLANGRNHVAFTPTKCSALRINLQGPAAPANLRLIELKAYSE
jgi:hypothetical protein